MILDLEVTLAKIMKMKILITGATGLIGKELTNLILSKNHTVHYLTTAKTKIKESQNCKGFYWNLKQNSIDENCLQGVDVIVHLAGANIAKRWTKEYKAEILESRILSSQLLYNLVKSKPNSIKQLICASGTAIYPESYTKVYDETTTEIDEGFLSNVVKQWEESVDIFEELGIKVCKLRTGIVFSKTGGALPQMAKPIQMGFGAALGNGNQIQSWIHLKDLVALYFFTIENALSGVFNAVSPEPVTNKDLTKIIASTLGKPLFLPNIPKFVLRFMLGEMSSILFSSKLLSAQKIIDNGFDFKFPKVQQAITAIFSE